MVMKMAKRKVPERPEDCKTTLDKVEYSNMIREKWESIPYDAPPSAISDLLDKYPFDPTMPHTHPEWSAQYARSELEKRRMQGRAKRRLLRGQ
jgi:hypothetical protein